VGSARSLTQCYADHDAHETAHVSGAWCQTWRYGMAAMAILAGLACGFRCKDEAVYYSQSPKGPHQLRVALRQCGGTAPDAVVVQGAEWLQWKDLVLVQGRVAVETRWTSVKTVEIGYHSCGGPSSISEVGRLTGLRIATVEAPTLASRCSDTAYPVPTQGPALEGRITTR